MNFVMAMARLPTIAAMIAAVESGGLFLLVFKNSNSALDLWSAATFAPLVFRSVAAFVGILSSIHGKALTSQGTPKVLTECRRDERDH